MSGDMSRVRLKDQTRNSAVYVFKYGRAVQEILPCALCTAAAS